MAKQIVAKQAPAKQTPEPPKEARSAKKSAYAQAGVNIDV